MVFGQLEEGANSGAVTVRQEAVIVLAVAVLLVVCGIEAAEAVCTRPGNVFTAPWLMRDY